MPAMVLLFHTEWPLLRTLSMGFIWLFVGLLLQATAHAKVFEGMGQAYIVANQVETARQLAYQMALQQAVQKALETQLQGDKKAIGDAQLQIQQLSSKAAKLATAKPVINETREGNLLQLTLALDLSEHDLSQIMDHAKIGNRASAAVTAAAHPSVMVVVNEELSGHMNPEPYSQTAILHQLRAAGFRMVDKVAMGNSIAHDRAVQGVLRGDIKAAQAAALQFGAALIVTGRASAQASGLRGGGMQVYGASITIRAYQADSAAVLASGSADASYPHINATSGQKQALESAAKKAAQQLIDQLETEFAQSGDTVAVSISAISYYQLSILKKILQRDFPEIISLQQRAFAADVARLDIRVPDPQAFTDKVVQRDFGSFRLDVVQFSPHKVDFVLLRKGN